MVAGYETTSTALSWFIYFMSKHPDIQQKIKREISQNVDTQSLTLNQLDSLVYLDCVINEIMRFCPPIYGTLRTLTCDDILPESNFQLYKGDSVLIPFSNLARDTRYWSIDPEKFYPDRFLGEDKNYLPYAFIPFGNGHRQCIGQDLARLELKVIMARMMQQLTFGDGGPELNSGGFVTNLTIMPKHIGVTMDFA